jgi:NAD(P)-dependent dehydrogenase (short-subunit alcohol dehydrogenase family)
MSWFDGARIAVTGAAGGIGEAVCGDLITRGARVYALDIANAPVGEFVACDVSDEHSVQAAIDRIVADTGGIDGLVAAAGVVEDNVATEELTAAEFDRVFGVNLRGVFLTCTAAGRHMLAAGAGCIVTVSSMSGNLIVNFPQRQCAYNASKAAVTALTRSLAVEWGPRGVRCNAISPGYVATPLNELKKDLHEQWKQGTVAGRFAEPEEIAAGIAWLLGDDAGFCLGTELVVDGGFSLR